MGEAIVGAGTVLLLCLILAAGAAALLRRWTRGLDPASRLAVPGLLALGGVGTATYALGAIGLVGGRFIPLGFALLFLIPGLLARTSWRAAAFSLPRGTRGLIAAGAILAVLFSLSGVLTPSTPLDWDTLAYHLAVPKLWIESGRVGSVPFVHQSNFPAAADSLFLLGLPLGGQAGAKAFMFAAYVLGVIAVFGEARRRYGTTAGGWAALLFAATPMAMWEAGSAYVDGLHGLYGGLALWLLADDSEDAPPWPLAAGLLAFALGTKYTGLQAAFVAGALLLLGRRRRDLAPVLGVAALLGGWWYVRNLLAVGNPVFPFFFSLLGGKNWDAFAARIYAEEQGTFGLGRGPGGVLGLAVVPGRFTNPGPTLGAGFVFASVGAAGLAGLFGWGLKDDVPRLERRVLLACGGLLVMWLLTSQQSRYILTLLPIMAILAGGLAARSLAWAGIVAANALVGLFVFSRTLLPERLPFLSGGLTATEYVSGFDREDGSRAPGRVPFARAAAYLNEVVPKSGGVALYDEVFGYLLDVRYRWAGPGHSTELDYARLTDGKALADRLRALGMTHVYVDAGVSADPRFVAALSGTPYDSTEARAFVGADPRLRWRWLLADAVARGELVTMQTFGRRFVFRLGPPRR